MFKYVDHPLFPADADSGLPHVLEMNHDEDVEGNDASSVKNDHQLCDYIVTLLANLKEHPTAIQDFFNPKFRLIRFVRYPGKDSKGFMIVREGNEVAVSYSKLS
jgi:hypothetical protein